MTIDPSDDEEDLSAEDGVGDVSEFASYGPILGCAAIAALLATLLITAAVRAFGAPDWADYVVGLVYVTLPYAAFTRWVWNKKAIRLANGKILTGREARRLALMIWALAAALIVVRLVTVLNS
ncbi:hypothetical protein BH11PSE6_BH11PSE6_15460 [soil metagenome]